MDFQIGDRVLYMPLEEGVLLSVERKAMAGQEATIVGRHRVSSTIGIKFDAPIGLHDCDGLCESPYGKWALPEDLVLINDGSGTSVDVAAFL